MLSRGGRHSQRYAFAAASFVLALGFPSWSPEAEPVDDADGVSFEERFSTEIRSAPTFTLPEVAELFTTAQPLQLSEAVASPETTIGDAPDRPLGEIVFAEPKGPVRVLGKLLNTPVQDLLIPRAEAGPEAPQGDLRAASSSGAPASEQSPPSPAQNSAAVPARDPDPIIERPSGEQVASIPAPDPAANRPASRVTPPLPDAAPAQDRAEAPVPPVPASPQANAPEELAASGSPAANTHEVAEPPTRAAAASGAPTPESVQPGGAPTVRESRRIGGGRAAWYEHPGRTASGERFDPNQLTAAHHTLPFGTRVRVVNEQTGLSVVVRINDRLPRKAKFTIDLSRASARIIGITGIARVALYEVKGS